MGIVAEDVERTRSATDLVALISEHVALRRVGTRWVGLCPFHSEKTSSFSVNAELGRYYCFGCQVHGDAISFLRETEHLDFVTAVEALASRAGVALRYDTAEHSGPAAKRSAALGEAMEHAVEWYHQRLLVAKDAGGARRYLRDRGYGSDTVKHFRLGWAPAGWDVLVRDAGVSADLLVEAGLAYRNQSGRLNDSFRERVLFPIFDIAGRPVGLGGRVLPGGNGPKYKNTSATALYDKSRVLYGLNWAKGAIVERGRVVVCEGYTDVIGLHSAGVTEAVATCGTALADGHVRLLTGFSRRIVLAYDAGTIPFAARLVWMLRYYGHAEAYVLAGGIAAWTAAGKPLETAAPPIVRATFLPRENPAVRATRAEVQAIVAGTLDEQLIETQRDQTYAQRDRDIPGAVRLSGNVLLDDARGGRIAERATLDRLVASARLDPHKRTVVTCGSGVSASGAWLALRAAGFDDVAVYDGSWMEWSHDGLPTVAKSTGS